MVVLNVIWLLLHCVAVTRAYTSGVKATLTQNGIDYARETALAAAMAQLATIQIPDQSGTASAGVLGTVDWQLTDIELSGVQLGSSSSQIESGDQLLVTADYGAATINANYAWQQEGWPHASGSGGITVSASDVDVSVDTTVSDSNGRPYLSVDSVSVTIGQFSASSSGGPSWLINIVLQLFQNQIKGDVETALQNAIQTALQNNVNALLQGLPITAPITPWMQVDYSLSDNPSFAQSSYLSVPFVGSAELISSPSPAPGVPAVMPDEVDAQMIQLFVSNYSLASAGYVAFQAGKLNGSVSSGDVPPNSPVQLNTAGFKFLIPALYQTYPNYNMSFTLGAVTAPQVTLQPNNATVSATGRMDVYVIDPNTYETPVFSLGLLLGASVAPALTVTGSSIVLSGKVTDTQSQLWLLQSEIGPFDPSTLAEMISLFLQIGVVPEVNGILANGFPLPNTKGLTWVSPALAIADGYLYVTTDVQYSTP